MTAQQAMEIAAKAGAFTPSFHGEVVIRIKGGRVSAVDVKRTYLQPEQ